MLKSILIEKEMRNKIETIIKEWKEKVFKDYIINIIDLKGVKLTKKNIMDDENIDPKDKAIARNRINEQIKAIRSSISTCRLHNAVVDNMLEKGEFEELYNNFIKDGSTETKKEETST